MYLLCKWCGETKRNEEFLKRNKDLPYDQSNVRSCKKCNAAKNRARYNDPETRTKQLTANKRWRKSNKSKMRSYERSHHEKFPTRQHARNRVRHLVRSGYWKSQPCCKCGSTQQVEAHHDSYAEPHWETVRWLCKAHHERWHMFYNPTRDNIIAEPLVEVERLRERATSIMEQINLLRIEYKSCCDEASKLELSAWSRVLEAAEPLFKEFLRVS